MKFAHTADWHLTDRHMGVSRRGRDMLRAALSAITVSREAGAEFVVVGGDIFDKSKLGPGELLGLKAVHELACAAGLPVLCIEGNHDHGDPPWSSVIGFRPEAGTCVEVDRPGVWDITGLDVICQGLRVRGLGCVRPTEVQSGISVEPVPDIAVWHGMVRELLSFPEESALVLSETQWPEGLKALLLGDIHTPTVVDDRGVLVGYPGATETMSAGEPLEHHVMLVDTAVTPWSWSPLPVAHRKALVARIKTREDLDKFLGELRACAAQDPLILGRYSREVPETHREILRVVDPDRALIRVYPEAPASFGTYVDRGYSPSKLPSVRDMAAVAFKDRQDLAELSVRLCDDPDRAQAILETHVTEACTA